MSGINVGDFGEFASINMQLNRVIKALLDDFIYYSDSGHGFKTSGKRSTDGSLRENEFNSAVEDKLCLLLSMNGIKYRMIAPEWNDVHWRARLARERVYYKKDTDAGLIPFGISIHANAHKLERAEGTETFHYGRSSNGKILATCVHNASLESNAKHGYNVYDRGVKTANFFMVKRTAAVWCLWEAAFMTNDENLELLKSDEFRNDCAMALFQGIINYAIEYRKLNNLPISL